MVNTTDYNGTIVLEEEVVGEGFTEALELELLFEELMKFALGGETEFFSFY